MKPIIEGIGHGEGRGSDLGGIGMVRALKSERNPLQNKT